MSLAQQIEKDFLTAYKAKEADRVGVLRMLKTAIKNKAVELGATPDDAQTLAIVKKEVKQRRDAAEQFTSAGRDELAAKELAEIELLHVYLPKELSEEELAALVDAAIAESGATSMKEMGVVMKLVQQKGGGAVNGGVASQLVKARLSG